MGEHRIQDYGFKKGDPRINRKGPPVGNKHMTTLLKDALINISANNGTKEDVAIIQALIRRAKAGDTKAIDMVFDRTEGKVQQTVDLKADIVTTELSLEERQKLLDLL